jgi:phage terminase large subunit
VKISFDTHGNEKQKEVCRHWVNPYISDIVYGGSKGSGKSYLGCSLIFGDALLYAGTHYFIARKKLNDLRKHTKPSVEEVFRDWGLDPEKYYHFNGTDNFFTLHNGSKVFFIEASFQPGDEQYQRFGSMQMTRGWIEEAGELDEEAKGNLAATTGRWKNKEYGLSGKILQTCNPSKNYLYREYYRKNKEKKLEPWKRFVQALPEDNQMLPEDYIPNLHRVLTKNAKERLLKGNWEYDDDPTTMCGYEAILDIFTNEYVSYGTSYISADIARMGKDKTVIRVWSGWRCVRRVELEKKTVVEVAERIRELATEYQVGMSRVIVDEDGVGGGVKDILHCEGFIANSIPLITYEVNAQGTTVKENFNMLKSQCAFKLADIINSGKMYDPLKGEEQQTVIEELEQLKQQEVDSDKKKAIVSKDDMKTILNRSPDDLDTYIMRAYFDVLLSTTPQGAPSMQVF